jgi:hypothetical protein
MSGMALPVMEARRNQAFPILVPDEIARLRASNVYRSGDRGMVSGRFIALGLVGLTMTASLGVWAHDPESSSAPCCEGAWMKRDDHAAFLQENSAAMSAMMQAMSVKSSGHVDRDFAAMMVPHHQGAINMAVVYLRYGHNEQLRRIAQEIIVTQQQEIAVMRLAIEDSHSSGSSPSRPFIPPSRDDQGHQTKQ